ncbi:CRISPR-associated helicase Cas3' [Methanospirillum purgamenti]|uniref:CRISPR-associated helicase Cas3 n=1 Tax=Methanospirillum hungatei TaxID=2203 RepID=A0A8F5VQ39_METHU|nr:CRISPR-associated helicase Cas3' [Methanospirillum hungatei]QXO95660.1 CRISPR-associated helicase Cas3' [Methanospirillum hungatei]
MITQILAKSNGETLVEHTLSCLNIYQQLIDIFPDLDKYTDFISFYEVVFQALFLHDVGKSSEEFQKYLKGLPNEWNHYRHEILSTPFVNLLNIKESERDIIKTLVLTHHKDLDGLIPYSETLDYLGKPFSEHMKSIVVHQEEINIFFDELFNCITYFSDHNLKITSFSEQKHFTNDDWEDTLIGLSQSLRKNEKFKNWFFRIGIMGKGMINASDYLASGGIKEILKPLPSLEEVYTFKKRTSIQEKCLNLIGNAILISPTGSGKTEAALFWATNNLNQTKGNRIFFTLPYTASINALYIRLRKKFHPWYQSEDFISLLHGRAGYFLSQMYEDQKTSLHLAKISHQICSPYKIMTPFQAIRHFFSLKGYEMGLLEMYQGIFIFDEIHSYEPRTVALILGMCSFLKNKLDAKILLMSATLPSFISSMFQKDLDINQIITMEKNEQNEYLRHRCFILDGTILDNLSYIKAAIQRKKRVLVVCNTVKQAQIVYNELYSPHINSALLHSKFILKDREEIENIIITGEITEDENPPLQLLVGTQTVEVSLDIDYDICFTEPAPIDALIQRFGRVNRKKEKGICPVYVFRQGSDSDKFIYNPEKVQKTLSVLSEIEYLHEWELQRIVDCVYSDGFGEKQEEFENTYHMFTDVLNEIVPLKNYDRKESDFFKLFDSIEVIPNKFLTEVKMAVEEGNFFEIMKYTLPLSKGQFYRLKIEGRVSNESEYLFIDAKYDSHLGLILSASDSSII